MTAETTPAQDTTPTKATTRKAPAKKSAPAEFAPQVTDKGRLDHTDCGHERTMKGRTACRAEYAKAVSR
jgi:hypothetical protein